MFSLSLCLNKLTFMLRNKTKLRSRRFRPRDTRLNECNKIRLLKSREIGYMPKKLPIRRGLKIRRLSALQKKQLRPLRKSALRLMRPNWLPDKLLKRQKMKDTRLRRLKIFVKWLPKKCSVLKLQLLWKNLELLRKTPIVCVKKQKKHKELER